MMQNLIKSYKIWMKMMKPPFEMPPRDPFQAPDALLALREALLQALRGLRDPCQRLLEQLGLLLARPPTSCRSPKQLIYLLYN